MFFRVQVFQSPCFSGSRFFRVHFFQGQGFSESMFFRVQVFQSPDFLGSGFFRVQVFQGPGFSGSRLFKVQVLQGTGFPGSGSRDRVQVLEVVVDTSRKLLKNRNENFSHSALFHPKNRVSLKYFVSYCRNDNHKSNEFFRFHTSHSIKLFL